MKSLVNLLNNQIPTMGFLKLIIFVSILAIIEPREICYDNYGCFQSSYNLFREKPIVILPESPFKINTTFNLYNSLTSGKSISVNNVKGFIEKAPTKLIIHGLFNNALNQWVIDLKDAILRKENVNVITVDWSDGNRNLYAVFYFFRFNLKFYSNLMMKFEFESIRFQTLK